MLVANTLGTTGGYVVDLELLSGNTASKTFDGSTTYYIPGTYWVQSTSTFVGGTVIKLGPVGSLWVSGSVVSPTVGVATITVRDDDVLGERVVNAGSPPYTSDGIVSGGDYAGNALNEYYVSNGTVLQRFRIRYADHAIHDYSPNNSDTVKLCRLENANYGAYAYYTTIWFLNNEICSVGHSCYAGNGGTVYEDGTVTDCGPVFCPSSFLGVQSGEVIDGKAVASPPDNMGAIGPDHYVELINGAIVIFNRSTGSRIAQMNTDNFFQVTVLGTTYPRAGHIINDPRIIYDHRSGRWIACAKEDAQLTNNQVVLAVSKGGDPVGDPASDWRNLKWDRYLVSLSEQNGGYLDFPTLGTDDNGVYIAVNRLDAYLSTIAAIAKGPLLTNSTMSATYFRSIPEGTIQPAVNFDATLPNGPAWFVAHRLSQYKDIVYATLTWNAGIPTLSSWTTISTDPFGPIIRMPSKGTSSFTYFYGFPGQIENAAIRNSQLWACRSVGLNSSGGATASDRNGCEWLRLGLSGATATLGDNGRVYDNAPSNPMSYIYPTIMVNSQGAVVMTFSGAGMNAYYGAYAVGRSPADPSHTMSSIKILRIGDAPFDGGQWGDYTAAALDPRNSSSIWTIQQYARVPSSNWRTWIGEIVPILH